MLKLLIVDDSIVFRTYLKQMFANVQNIEVVGSASNGRIALSMLQQKQVDLVILDMNMPEMDGLNFLRELKKMNFSNLKVIVFASETSKSISQTMEALSLGASDFILKPTSDEYDASSAQNKIVSDLIPKVSQFISSAKSESPTAEKSISKIAETQDRKKTFDKGLVDSISAIAIASSTGGPRALEVLFSKFGDGSAPPVFIAQHMPPKFTKSLAERLSGLYGLDCVEASNGMLVQRGRIYIAPGDYHMQVDRNGAEVKIRLNQEERINGVRPAADILFDSVARIYGQSGFGIILTGMGYDGLNGAISMRSRDAFILIQDKETSTVWGMPGAAFEKNAYDLMAPIEECAKIMSQFLTPRKVAV